MEGMIVIWSEWRRIQTSDAARIERGIRTSTRNGSHGIMGLYGSLEDGEEFSNVEGARESRFWLRKSMFGLVTDHRVLKEKNIWTENRQNSAESCKHPLRWFRLSSFWV
jgi:hypothetical protein